MSIEETPAADVKRQRGLTLHDQFSEICGNEETQGTSNTLCITICLLCNTRIVSAEFKHCNCDEGASEDEKEENETPGCVQCHSQIVDGYDGYCAMCWLAAPCLY